MNNYVVTGNGELGHGNRKIQIQDLSDLRIEMRISELTHIDVSLFQTICEM